MAYKLDPEFQRYATPLQWEKLKAVEEHGSERAAAGALGIAKSNISTAKAAVLKKAAQHGYAPDHDMIHSAPEGFMVIGTSTLYDHQTGDAKIQWVKTKADDRQTELARQAAIDAVMEDVPRATISVKKRHYVETALLNQYTITDFHLGMLCWGEECGEDYDTAIAEKMLTDWFSSAIEQAPKAERAVLCQLGDFLHWDGMDAVTPASGHLLDADGRFQKIVRVAIRVLRTVVDMMRVKYPKVHIIMADANHDPASGIWLREMFAVMYEKDESVTVDTSPDTYYCVEHGQTGLFYHHGHKNTAKNVAPVFTQKFREVFGRTKHCYGHTGHLHHLKEDESNNLMVIHQHRTLAAKDAYSSRGGWHSGRAANVITYHKDFGEVGRITLSPDMFK